MTDAMTLMASIALVGFIWLTLFQVLLALGFPMGRLAWGGSHRVLSPSLRVASGVSACLAAFGAICVAQALGLLDWVPALVLRPALLVLAGLFGLSLIANALSKSRVEQVHGVVLTTLLCVGSLAAAFQVSA
ncbi:MAG: hypothetical protein JJ908_14295 [Rhizobiales bacterium]|nr:hypothetical protein [Hyphomicrobiales bacterium]MBO6700299.1 hypothetical protein [Hyphomicrobiales bacterium]MBO6737536.1 hypothetical protein [Hyphomicrobiales bacterium]MBO6913407.1 hypothetical protein [Hyphomicrobiales bacterium]MBO6955338.1 hypothetical protein [Hyphomicrobiales bacterium]